MLLQAGHQALIAQVYEAALDENRWSDLASRMAETFDSPSATIQVRSAEQSTQVLVFTDNIRIDDYERYYGQLDPWVQGALGLGMNRVVLGHELVDDASFLRSEFYADFAQRCGQHYIVGCLLEVTPTQFAGLGIHRGRSGRPFDEDDRRSVAQFADHLQRALRLRARLGPVPCQQRWTLEALALSNTRFFVVDEEARVHFASPDAARYCTPARPLQVSYGRLHPRECARQKAFSSMVRSAVALARATPDKTLSNAPSAMALPDERGGLLTLTVSPLAALPDSPARALVFFKDAAEGSVQPQRLQELFGLTPAEAGVACALVRGLSCADIAQTDGVSENTVRTHVRQVLQKTGTSRQGEFIALALRSVATVA